VTVNDGLWSSRVADHIAKSDEISSSSRAQLGDYNDIEIT